MAPLFRAGRPAACVETAVPGRGCRRVAVPGSSRCIDASASTTAITPYWRCKSAGFGPDFLTPPATTLATNDLGGRPRPGAGHSRASASSVATAIGPRPHHVSSCRGSAAHHLTSCLGWRTRRPMAWRELLAVDWRGCGPSASGTCCTERVSLVRVSVVRRRREEVRSEARRLQRQYGVIAVVEAEASMHPARAWTANPTAASSGTAVQHTQQAVQLEQRSHAEPGPQQIVLAQQQSQHLTTLRSCANVWTWSDSVAMLADDFFKKSHRAERCRNQPLMSVRQKAYATQSSRRGRPHRLVDSADSTILELGCGTGRITHPLIARGHQVLAVDESPDTLARVTGRTALRPDRGLSFGTPVRRGPLHVLPGDVPDDEIRRRMLDTCAQHVRRRFRPDPTPRPSRVRRAVGARDRARRRSSPMSGNSPATGSPATMTLQVAIRSGPSNWSCRTSARTGWPPGLRASGLSIAEYSHRTRAGCALYCSDWQLAANPVRYDAGVVHAYAIVIPARTPLPTTPSRRSETAWRQFGKADLARSPGPGCSRSPA